MKFRQKIIFIMLLGGGIQSNAFAQELLLKDSLNTAESDLYTVKSDLYGFCHNQAQSSSGYIGLVPAEHRQKKLLNNSFDVGRNLNDFDVRNKPSRRAGARLGANFSFTFGSKNKTKPVRKSLSRRRDYRKQLNGCIRTGLN